MLLQELGNGELPSLVIFDLDGTLVDSVPDLAVAVNTMLAAMNKPEVSQDCVRNWVGNGAPMLVRRALAVYDGKAAEGLGNDDIVQPLSLFMQAYSQQTSALSRLYPGAHECLRKLYDLGIKIAIVTNKPKQFVGPILKSLNIQGYISFVVGGDCLKEKKPHPLPLLHCLARYGVDNKQALMIGDSRHDISAAKAAGIPVVAVTYGYNHGQSVACYKPDAVVDSLLELAS